jgi:hypothetical protein
MSAFIVPGDINAPVGNGGYGKQPWMRPEDYVGRTIWAKCSSWKYPREGHLESEVMWWNPHNPKGLLWWFVCHNATRGGRVSRYQLNYDFALYDTRPITDLN